MLLLLLQLLLLLLLQLPGSRAAASGARDYLLSSRKSLSNNPTFICNALLNI